MGLRDRFTGPAHKPTPKGPSTILGTRGPAPAPFVTVNLFLSPALETGLGQIQEALSWYEEPIPISWVFGWLYLRVKEHKPLGTDLHSWLKDWQGTGLKSESEKGEAFRKTSLRVPQHIRDWLQEATGQSSYSAPTLMLRWTLDRWDFIVKNTGPFEPGRVGRPVPSAIPKKVGKTKG